MKLPGHNMVPKVIESSSETDSFDVMTQIVYDSIDGRASIADLGEICGLEADLVQRIIGKVIKDGLVTVDESGSSPTPADQPVAANDSRSELEIDIDRIYDLPESVILYDLLDAQPDATRIELRNSYFSLSKRFHPDRIPSASAPEVKRKTEVVFRRLTGAYDTLSNARSREEYDASISDHLELWRIEQKLRSAIKSKEETAAKSEPPRSATPASQPPGQTTGKPRASGVKVGSETRAARKKTTTRKARARVSLAPRARKKPGFRVSPGQKKPAATAPTASASDAPPENIAARRRALKQKRAGRVMKDFFKRSSSVPPGPTQAQKTDSKPPEELKPTRGFDPRKTVPHLRDAEIALERGEFTEAITFLEHTLSYAPHDAKALHMLELAKAGQERAQMLAFIVKGKKETRRGLWSDAIKHFKKAVLLDHKNLDARHLLADAMLQSRQDLPRALAIAKEICDRGGDKPAYFATLGELYLLGQEFELAKEQFIKALEKEPKNKQYKKRLKACKR